MKKLVNIFCVGAVLLTMTAAAYAADFSDMPQNEQERAALENAVENGLLTGYENGEIRPYGNITRAEMATILVRAMGAEVTADISEFKDMSPDQWYYDSMSKAVAMDAFQGDGENLNPESNITFQEALTVLARVFDLQSSRDIDQIKLMAKKIDALPEYTSDVLDQFSDKEQISDWAVPSIRAVVEGGYWSGKDSKITPLDYMNRTDFSIVMDNLIKNYIDEPGTYTEFEEGNVMIRSNDVTIQGLTGDCTVYTGDGVKSGIVLEDVNIDRLVMRAGQAKAGGVYNQLRMIGHNCVIEKSDLENVSLYIYGRYPDSTINVGSKDLS